MGLSESPSRRRSRRERELANRRLDAIEGAAAVFATKGFHEAQMTEIAATAELSLASLYSMFRGKEELYREVLRTATERIRESVQNAAAEIDDAAEALLAVIDGMFACFDDMHDLMRMVMTANQGLPWRIREHMGETSREAAESFFLWVVGLANEAREQGYLKGMDPEVFARVMMAAVASTGAHIAQDDADRTFSSAAPEVRAIFARVLAPPAHA